VRPAINGPASACRGGAHGILVVALANSLNLDFIEAGEAGFETAQRLL
jgi:hypothetical protein